MVNGKKNTRYILKISSIAKWWFERYFRGANKTGHWRVCRPSLLDTPEGIASQGFFLQRRALLDVFRIACLLDPISHRWIKRLVICHFNFDGWFRGLFFHSFKLIYSFRITRFILHAFAKLFIANRKSSDKRWKKKIVFAYFFKLIIQLVDSMTVASEKRQ